MLLHWQPTRSGGCLKIRRYLANEVRTNKLFQTLNAHTGIHVSNGRCFDRIPNPRKQLHSNIHWIFIRRNRKHDATDPHLYAKEKGRLVQNSPINDLHIDRGNNRSLDPIHSKIPDNNDDYIRNRINHGHSREEILPLTNTSSRTHAA